jgi:hypothetical protein
MPDQTGKLTPGDVQQVKDWLNRRGKQAPYPCPFCGTADWSIGSHVIRQELASTSIRTGEVVPCVIVNCMNCALMLHFNAVLLQLYTPTANVKGVPHGQ